MKVLTWEGNFFEFTEGLIDRFPHITFTRVQPYREAELGFEVEITDMEAYYEEVFRYNDAEAPDILILHGDTNKYIEASQLEPLEPYITGDSFYSETYSADLLQRLRLLGGGQIYSLTDSFYIEGLFYNKTLLDQYHLPYPYNGMSWEEVLKLAGSVPKEQNGDHIIGYYAGISEHIQPWRITQSIGLSYRLDYINNQEKKVTINTESWKRVWQMVLEGYMSGAIENLIQPLMEEGFSEGLSEVNKPFISGEAVLYKTGVNLISQLEKQELPFEWGVITEPVNPDLKEGVTMMPGFNYSIFAASPHNKEAWEVIQYMTSEEKMKQTTASSFDSILRFNLPARQSASEVLDFDFSAFYEMPQSEYVVDYTNWLIDFGPRFEELANKTFERLLSQSITIDDALYQLEAEAQTILDTID